MEGVSADRVREQEGVRGRQTGKAEFPAVEGAQKRGARDHLLRGRDLPESLGSTADGQPPLKRWGLPDWPSGVPAQMHDGQPDP